MLHDIVAPRLRAVAAATSLLAAGLIAAMGPLLVGTISDAVGTGSPDALRMALMATMVLSLWGWLHMYALVFRTRRHRAAISEIGQLSGYASVGNESDDPR